MNRRVFFLSDGTGITAEALGHSLISQFDGIRFDCKTIPYIDSLEKAVEAANTIRQHYEQDKLKPLIFTTLVDPKIRDVFKESHLVVYDLFQAFLKPLEKELKVKSTYTIGKAHSAVQSENYESRIHAINYALANDDGVGIHKYGEADLIIIGVSRSGKTPTSLYLALHFGILVANYPLTDDDMGVDTLPAALSPYKSKLFGLTITPERLHTIRQERRPNSRYSSLAQCRQEIRTTRDLFTRENIPSLDSTAHSIEEIATKILAITKLERKIF